MIPDTCHNPEALYLKFTCRLKFARLRETNFILIRYTFLMSKLVIRISEILKPPLFLFF